MFAIARPRPVLADSTGYRKRNRIDLRVVTSPIEQQETITRDSVTVKVNAVLWYQVSPEKAVLNKVDHKLTEADNAFVRYSQGRSDLFQPGSLPTPAVGGTVSGPSTQPAHQAVFNEEHIVSPTTESTPKTRTAARRWRTSEPGATAEAIR